MIAKFKEIWNTAPNKGLAIITIGFGVISSIIIAPFVFTVVFVKTLVQRIVANVKAR